MPYTPTAAFVPPSDGRDLRIDLMRGLCLWMIIIDHLPGNPLQHITYGHFGLPDAFDAFVFLSGISSALGFGKLVRASAFLRAQLRASRRAVQLYIANLFIGLVNIAVFFGFRDGLDGSYLADYDLTLLAHEPLRAIVAMAALLYTPQMMDILPLYMLLISAAPAILLLLIRSEAAGLALSVGIWLIAAVVPQLNIPSLGGNGAWPYNPFSWQILFCIGLWVGKRHYVDGVSFYTRPVLQGLCWAIVAVGYIAAFAARHDSWFSSGTALLTWATDGQTRFQIHPARLLNLLATAYIVASYLRPDSSAATSQLTSLLRLCGRHSLEAFCAGLAVTIPGAILLQPNNPLALEIVLTLGGWAAMTAVAKLVHSWGRRREKNGINIPLASEGVARTDKSRIHPAKSGCGWSGKTTAPGSSSSPGCTGAATGALSPSGGGSV
jgi:hypothetical protein